MAPSDVHRIGNNFELCCAMLHFFIFDLRFCCICFFFYFLQVLTKGRRVDDTDIYERSYPPYEWDGTFFKFFYSLICVWVRHPPNVRLWAVKELKTPRASPLLATCFCRPFDLLWRIFFVKYEHVCGDARNHLRKRGSSVKKTKSEWTQWGDSPSSADQNPRTAGLPRRFASPAGRRWQLFAWSTPGKTDTQKTTSGHCHKWISDEQKIISEAELLVATCIWKQWVRLAQSILSW